jgi:UDP-GlcNAc:undecaprenyl-phosphate GlcNAc-1-phosphate transferase
MFPILLTFIIASIGLYLSSWVAVSVGLIDRPSGRKQHEGNIPLVGGISIYFSVALSLLIYPQLLTHSTFYLLCSSVLICVGIIDDKYGISAWVRLVVISILAIALVLIAEISIHDLGNIISFGYSQLEHGELLITLLAIIGAITAFNMVDGLDGLLGGVSWVTLGALALLFYLNDQTELMFFCFIFISAMIPYLLSNLGLLASTKIFMGDAGSMFIGFTLVWLLIEGSQSHAGHIIEHKINAVTTLWLIAIPLIDLAAIIIHRISKGQSPLKADREHIHHIFLRLGLSYRQTLYLIIMLALVCAGIGVVGEVYHVNESIMFVLFIILFICYSIFFSYLRRIIVTT